MRWWCKWVNEEWLSTSLRCSDESFKVCMNWNDDKEIIIISLDEFIRVSGDFGIVVHYKRF